MVHRQIRARARFTATGEAVDFALDRLESVLIELDQREWTSDQLARFGRLLERTDDMVIGRRPPPDLHGEPWGSLHGPSCSNDPCTCRRVIVLLKPEDTHA
jgi:hypothetical protein